MTFLFCTVVEAVGQARLVAMPAFPRLLTY
jgi:hypothetical protein